jgi:hypothetical protein
MFVTSFKHALQSLPCRDASFDVFMGYLSDTERFGGAAMEFFDRVTTYAVKQTSAVPPVQYDWRFMTTAFALTRFPIEILRTPEEPYRFSLLDKAWKYLGMVDIVLYVCDRAEDDAVDDFLDSDTCAEYLQALNEFRGALYALWEADSAARNIQRSDI